MNLSARETAQVLHALRVVQEIRDDSRVTHCTTFENKPDPAQPCDHFTDVPPLTDEEIDTLCEKINDDPQARAEALLLEMQNAQTALWEASNDLEKELGFEIDTTNDLEGETIESLIEQFAPLGQDQRP